MKHFNFQILIQYIKPVDFGFNWLAILCAFSLLFLSIGDGKTQSYFAYQGNPTTGNQLYKFNLNCLCTGCSQVEVVGPTGQFGEQLTMSPEGHLFGYDGDLYRIDTSTGAWSLYCDLPDLPLLGLLSIGGGIFYSMLEFDYNKADTLLEINANTGTVTALGRLPYTGSGDMMMYNGEIYYLHIPDVQQVVYRGIVKVDPANIDNSTLVVSYSMSYGFLGISATNMCNVFLAADLVQGDEMVLINIIDGAITPLFNDIPDIISVTSMQEFVVGYNCNTIDLDCNDSSGATGGDYNGNTFDCYSDGLRIADKDVAMTYDSLIMEMRVRLTGFTPDIPEEYLELTQSISFLNVTGNGTNEIIFVNEGFGYSETFKEALKYILYKNEKEYPTGGLRTIEVQFTTASGAVSTTAITSIMVEEHPLLPIDLGPDLVLCEGESATFDAGNPGADFHWSNGANLQTITVNQPGQYIVTVGTSVNCPNRDTVNLAYLPNVFVWLDGDTEICEGNSASLTLHVDSPIPITVEIQSTPGAPITIESISGGNFPISDLLSEETHYVITEVSHNQPACLEVTDSVQTIKVFPTYNHYVEVQLCEGDSIYVGNDWESATGVYDAIYFSEWGCDSTVTTAVVVLPVVTIYSNNTSCDPAEVGVFQQFLQNLNGCDTILISAVSLLTSDTVSITRNTCTRDSAGTTIQLLANQFGCDSLVTTTLISIPPMDTTFLFQTSCDVSLLGVFEFMIRNQNGCDSLVILTVSPEDLDTTYQFGTSCDPANLGVFESHFTTANGCDSTVLTTISYSAVDSTFINSSSCHPSETGVYVSGFINLFGCDSIVTETISLLPSDEIFISSTTCDLDAIGDFTDLFINQYGCDSIVHTSVALLPTSETYISSATCKASEAGIFVTTFLNQYGCDSIVTHTISLLPMDTTWISKSTCDPAQVGAREILLNDIDGCDSLEIVVTTLFPLPEGLMQVTSNYNGYDISCFGGNNGSITASVQGIPPFTFLWSNGSPDASISNLSAGNYSVMITDGNGCRTSGVVQLTEPSLLESGYNVSHPDCFGVQDGSISITPIGGVPPFSYSLDGMNFQSSYNFTGLSDDVYLVQTQDANQCITVGTIWIDHPIVVDVELGEDQVIGRGDSVLLQVNINIPVDSIASVEWTGIENGICPQCMAQFVAPLQETTYTVTVTTLDGCSDSDSKTIGIRRNDEIYIPNIFSPNGDGINDLLMISAGADVQEISSFVIFDRWGNMVFSADHFEADDPSVAWDGTRHGVKLNPMVYTYRMVVSIQNPDTNIVSADLRYGDITLIR